MVNEYTKDIEELLCPFYEATLYAKSLGNLSIKKPIFNLRKILQILDNDIETIIMKKKYNSDRSEEYIKVIASIEFILSNYNF